MLELIHAVGRGLVMICPLANLLTTVVLFLGLAGNMSLSERNRQALQYTYFLRYRPA
ncbi:hypothetical protein PEC301937_03960 [Pectobacterium carotovorum subsp. carotovorum]|nr:hypothetical protein PEC301937_03960 [Pectobacterium carotovorum subsp. carotovorum]